MDKQDRIALIRDAVNKCAKRGAGAAKSPAVTQPLRRPAKTRHNQPALLMMSPGRHPAMPGFSFNILNRYWPR